MYLFIYLRHLGYICEDVLNLWNKIKEVTQPMEPKKCDCQNGHLNIMYVGACGRASTLTDEILDLHCLCHMQYV